MKIDLDDFAGLCPDYYRRVGEFALEFAKLEYGLAICLAWMHPALTVAEVEAKYKHFRNRYDGLRHALNDLDAGDSQREALGLLDSALRLADERNIVLHACLRYDASRNVIVLQSAAGSPAESAESIGELVNETARIGANILNCFSGISRSHPGPV